jgi:hypothetical protein
VGLQCLASRSVSYESAVSLVCEGCCGEGKKTSLSRLKAGVATIGPTAALRSKTTGTIAELAA